MREVTLRSAHARPPPAGSLSVGPPLSVGDERDAGSNEDYLHGTRARVGATMKPGNEPGDRNVKEAGSGKGQCVWQRTLRFTQRKVRHDCSEYRGKAGGEIEQQRPRARQPRLHENGEITHPVRDLVRRDCEGRERSELQTA